MRRVVIFGNSGSGKSTLANWLVKSESIAHFDLDEIAWLPCEVPKRAPVGQSAVKIEEFTSFHEHWVIEGCYADLIELAAPLATEMIFLNLSVDDCVKNAKMRDWEPHKYATKDAQDANLEMLISWIKDYPKRTDSCSLNAHLALYKNFDGKKRLVTTREKLDL